MIPKQPDKPFHANPGMKANYLQLTDRRRLYPANRTPGRSCIRVESIAVPAAVTVAAVLSWFFLLLNRRLPAPQNKKRR